MDTELLDDELLELLKEQLWGGIKYLRPGLKDDWEPELVALLRAALWKLSIWDNDATYGASLQGLRYVDARRRGKSLPLPFFRRKLAGSNANSIHEGPVDHAPSKTQKLLYGAITVLGRYAFTRLDMHMISHPYTYPHLSHLLDRLSTVHSIASLFSFLAFLHSGRYRTILDRVLGMRLVPPDRQVAREVSFEFLNRQLVWHAFTEFLLFILPILRIGKWRRWWARFQRKMVQKGSDEKDGKGELSFLPTKTCAVCFKEGGNPSGGAGTGGLSTSTDANNPYEAECGCVYCYVCIATKIQLEEGEGWECLRCGRLVKRSWPWKGGDEGLPALPEKTEEKREKKNRGGSEEPVLVTRQDAEGHHAPPAYDSDSESSAATEVNGLRVVSPMPVPSSNGDYSEDEEDASSETTERAGWFTTRSEDGTEDEEVYATANGSEAEEEEEEDENGRRVF